MKKTTKNYSQLGLAIDLIVNEYGTLNPIKIMGLIEQDLDLNFTIHQITDYLDMNQQFEDYEKESSRQQFKMYY